MLWRMRSIALLMLSYPSFVPNSKGLAALVDETELRNFVSETEYLASQSTISAQILSRRDRPPLFDCEIHTLKPLPGYQVTSNP